MLKVKDEISGDEFEYPLPNEAVDYKYDFHYTKNGQWYYAHSCDNLDTFFDPNFDIITDIEKRGETWRIVEALTGNIVRKREEAKSKKDVDYKSGNKGSPKGKSKKVQSGYRKKKGR